MARRVAEAHPEAGPLRLVGGGCGGVRPRAVEPLARKTRRRSRRKAARLATNGLQARPRRASRTPCNCSGAVHVPSQPHRRPRSRPWRGDAGLQRTHHRRPNSPEDVRRLRFAVDAGFDGRVGQCLRVRAPGQFGQRCHERLYSIADLSRRRRARLRTAGAPLPRDRRFQRRALRRRGVEPFVQPAARRARSSSSGRSAIPSRFPRTAPPGC